MKRIKASLLIIFLLLLTAQAWPQEEDATVQVLAPGERFDLGDGMYGTWEFTQKPQIGMVILKIRLFDKNDVQISPLTISGRSGMPSMPGAPRFRRRSLQAEQEAELPAAGQRGHARRLGGAAHLPQRRNDRAARRHSFRCLRAGCSLPPAWPFAAWRPWPRPTTFFSSSCRGSAVTHSSGRISSTIPRMSWKPCRSRAWASTTSSAFPSPRRTSPSSPCRRGWPSTSSPPSRG